MKCNQTHFYYYYYDGVNLLFVKKDNAIDMRYLYDNEGNVYCAIANDGLPYWHHTDIRGSVTNVLKGDSGTSSSPTLIRSYVYNAYGDTDYSIFTGGETFNANSYLAYTGAILDQETGLYYLMSRYYDPKAGSFISQDSYKGEGDAFWHLYAYCDGDPVNNIDKTGHAKVTYTESKAAYNAVKKTKLFKIFPWKNGYVYNKSTIFSSRRGNVYQIRITSKSKRPPTYVLYVYRGSKNALKAYSEYLYDHSKKWNLDSWLNAIGVTLGFTSIISKSNVVWAKALAKFTKTVGSFTSSLGVAFVTITCSMVSKHYDKLSRFISDKAFNTSTTATFAYSMTKIMARGIQTFNLNGKMVSAHGG